MEKSTFYPQDDSGDRHRVSHRPSSGFLRNALVAVLGILVYQSFVSFLWAPFKSLGCWKRVGPHTVHTIGHETTNPHTFKWEDITPSKQLEFADCQDGFKCARLLVPMDYWNDTVPDAHMTLAVNLLPAKVPITDPRYGGPILINPGGPGGSGLHLAFTTGRQLQTIVDSTESSQGINTEDARYFDIMSFDPRGIGETLPRADCFNSDSSRAVWKMRKLEDGLIFSSDAAPSRFWSKFSALGASCKTFMEEGSDEDVSVMKYITTASVARDMLEINERYGEWREAQARKLVEEQNLDRRIVDKLAYKKDQEKLQYWGFSYGSFLGQTFASMFPDRVDRVIVDGIVDADDYIGGIWENNMEDTEKTLSSFYHYCAEAGPAGCALANSTSTADSIREKVDSLLEHLYRHPFIPVNDQPDILSWSILKLHMFDALYSPNELFPSLAEDLNSLINNDGHELLPMLERIHSLSCPAPNLPHQDGSNEAQQGIACGDAFPSPDVDLSFDEFFNYAERLWHKSPAAGGYWPFIRLSCVHWQIRPLYSYRGPFAGKTSNPVLFIGNTADPVTPVSAARKMAKNFEGAGVIVQDSPGHCSTSAFSRCTINLIKKYMRDGVVPDGEAECDVEEIPFQPFDVRGLSMEDLELYNVHKDLARGFEKARFGLGRPEMGF